MTSPFFMKDIYNLTSDSPTINASYKFPNDFISWKDLRCWFLVTEYLKNEKVDYKEPTERKVTHEMCEYDFPFFLLGRDFLEMMDHTDALDGFSFTEDAELPFPSFVFLFPKGSLVLPIFGGDFDTSKMQITGWSDHGDCGKTFCISTSSHRDSIHLGIVGDVFSSYVHLDTNGSIIHSDEHLMKYHEREGDQAPKFVEAHKMVAGLVTKVLSAMAAEPELVEKQFTEYVRTAKKGRPRLEFRQPKWIGRRVTFQSRPQYKEGDSHVRMHWRRGFFRRQRFGKGRVKSKVIYIRPVLVNSSEETK